jgi:hypothetical protein
MEANYSLEFLWISENYTRGLFGKLLTCLKQRCWNQSKTLLLKDIIIQTLQLTLNTNLITAGKIHPLK